MRAPGVSARMALDVSSRLMNRERSIHSNKSMPENQIECPEGPLLSVPTREDDESGAALCEHPRAFRTKRFRRRARDQNIPACDVLSEGGRSFFGGGFKAEGHLVESRRRTRDGEPILNPKTSRRDKNHRMSRVQQ